jgi:hypothetical protein
MAHILNVHVRKQTAPKIGRRYCFDEDKLMAHFGGRERLMELTRLYGVPPVPQRIQDRRRWNRDTLIAPYIPVLLELAERMHQPLELYPFVVELR